MTEIVVIFALTGWGCAALCWLGWTDALRGWRVAQDGWRDAIDALVEHIAAVDAGVSR